MDNGEQVEKMDVETERRSGRKLEGQLDQAGKDKNGGSRLWQHLITDIVFGTISGQVALLNNSPSQ